MRHAVDESVNDRDLLAEFFASQDDAPSAESTFTPADVADIVRRDRDASE